MKAIALISGGLDSVLAAKLIIDQGIEVIGLNISNSFQSNEVKVRGEFLAKKLNIKIRTKNTTKEFLKIVKSPRFGYGKNLNPCIDCRILMLKKAAEFMNEKGANFIVTGEVLGQRPMSQNKEAIKIIEKESGLEGLIVRPLSAKVLPPTIPEKEGWIEREKLLGIYGRTRKEQIILSRKLNISGYLSPAGGCLLTDPIFSLKVKDLLNSNMLTLHNINLIKNGRFFRISKSFKLIVGRNEEENNKLLNLVREKDYILEPESKGPIAIGLGKIEDKEIEIAGNIVAYYCKDKEVKINVRTMYGNKVQLTIPYKIKREELLNYAL